MLRWLLRKFLPGWVSDFQRLGKALGRPWWSQTEEFDLSRAWFYS